MSTVLVFGAGTNVGKTLLSAGLARAARLQGRAVLYVKPVQTGGPDVDQAFVRRHAPGLQCATLFAYPDPVSPHVAAARHASPKESVPSAARIRSRLSEVLQSGSREGGSTGAGQLLNIVETAGGVMSPFPDETPTADALELSAHQLKLRCILVGDGRLGGISHTLCALEALEKRRYDVASIVVFSPDAMETALGNAAYLDKRLIANPKVRHVPTDAIPSDPSRDVPAEFFDLPIFSQILDDVLDEAHDRRLI